MTYLLTYARDLLEPLAKIELRVREDNTSSGPRRPHCHVPGPLVGHVLLGRQSRGTNAGGVTHVQHAEIRELAGFGLAKRCKLSRRRRHSLSWHDHPRRRHVVSNACLVELVVVCLDRRVHVISPVTVIEHLSPHVRRVLFAVGSLHVRRVVVGLPVLAGLVLVVVSVPNGVVSCFGGPLAVRRVFWQFALRELP